MRRSIIPICSWKVFIRCGKFSISVERNQQKYKVDLCDLLGGIREKIIYSWSFDYIFANSSTHRKLLTAPKSIHMPLQSFANMALKIGVETRSQLKLNKPANLFSTFIP